MQLASSRRMENTNGSKIDEKAEREQPAALISAYLLGCESNEKFEFLYTNFEVS